MNFSERIGYKPSSMLGLEEISAELKMAIWNQTYSFVQYCIGRSSGISFFKEGKEYFPRALWSRFFHQALDEMPPAKSFLEILKTKFFALEWNRIYELVDFTLIEFVRYSEEDRKEQQEIIASIFNEILEEHNAPYRVCNNLVQPIIDNQFIEIAESANKLTENTEIQVHLTEAEQSYSSRRPGSGKFVDACRHSICALEVALRFYFHNNKTISQNVTSLKKEQKIHPTLINCIDQIAAFRGDSSGVGHALKIGTDKSETPLSPPNTLEEAILIHTLCCGFINFFRQKFKGTLQDT